MTRLCHCSSQRDCGKMIDAVWCNAAGSREWSFARRAEPYRSQRCPLLTDFTPTKSRESTSARVVLRSADVSLASSRQSRITGKMPALRNHLIRSTQGVLRISRWGRLKYQGLHMPAAVACAMEFFASASIPDAKSFFRFPYAENIYGRFADPQDGRLARQR